MLTGKVAIGIVVVCCALAALMSGLAMDLSKKALALLVTVVSFAVLALCALFSYYPHDKAPKAKHQSTSTDTSDSAPYQSNPSPKVLNSLFKPVSKTPLTSTASASTTTDDLSPELFTTAARP